MTFIEKRFASTETLIGQVVGVGNLNVAAQSLREIADQLEKAAAEQDQGPLLPTVELKWKLDPKASHDNGRGDISWTLEIHRWNVVRENP